MSLARRTARSLSLTGTAQVVQFALQLASASVLGRTIPTVDYGVFALAAAAAGLVAVARDFGIGQAALRCDRLPSALASRLHRLSVGIGALTAVLVVLAAPLAGMLLDNDRLPPLVMALAGPVLLAGFAVMPGVRLAREHRFTELAVVTFVAAVAGLATAVASALAGAGVWALVAQAWVVALVTLVGQGWRAPVAWRGGQDVSVRPVLAHGAWLAGSEVVWMSERHLQNAMFGRLFDEHVLAQVARPREYIDMPLRMLSGPLTSVGMPVLASLLPEPERFQRALLRIGGAAELLLTLPIALLIGCSQDGLRLLLGPDWLEAAGYCFWLAFLTVGQGGLLPLQWLLVLRAAGRLQVNLQVVSSVATLVGGGLGAWLAGGAGAVHGLLLVFWLVAALRVVTILPMGGIRIGAWAGQHLPLIGVQVVAGVAAHATARAVGDVGSLVSLAVGGGVAVLVGGIGLLGPRDHRQRLRSAIATLRGRAPA